MKAPWWVLASAALAALASLIPLSGRVRAEFANRALGMAVEGQGALDLAAHSGLNPGQAFAALREAGVVGITLSDESVSDLVLQGQASVKPSGEESVITGPPEALERIEKRMAAQAPGLVTRENGKLLVKGSPSSALGLSAGVDPRIALRARAAGLEIIVRHANFEGASPERVKAVLSLSRGLGARWLLPLGDQVLGWRGAEKSTGEALSSLGMFYCGAEFVKTSGDVALKTAWPSIVVRLHTVQPAEADRITPKALVERYAKAFRERNVRWLLVRATSTSESDSFGSFLSLLKSIRGAVAKEGGALRAPRPFSDPTPPVWQPLLVFLLAAPFISWCAAALFGLKTIPWWAWGGSGLAAAASLTTSGSPLAALLLASAFPVGAYLWLEGEEAPSVWPAGAVMTLLAFAGGLAVASQHVGLGWMIQNDQFSGIKAAHFAPIAVAGFLMLRKTSSVRDALASPILWGSALLAVVLLAAVAFMLARTGNDNPAGVSGLELQMRSVLDRILYTRPRTKEFLIGHPSLFVGLALLVWSQKRPSLKAPSVVLLAVGAIGLTSVVNTFCHFHTPLELNAARAAIGLVIGGILGGIAILVLRAFKLDQAAPG